MRATRVRAVAATAVAGAALLALVGCTRNEAPRFDASSYRGGDCQLAAPHVFAIATSVEPVLDDDAPSGDAVTEMTAAQRALIATMPSVSDATLRTQAQRVVDTVGFLRIGVDAKNYQPTLARNVSTAAESLLRGCSAT